MVCYRDCANKDDRQWYYTTQELKLADLDPSAEFAVVDSDDELDHDPHTDPKSDISTKDSRPTSPDISGEYPKPSRAEAKRAEATQALQSLEIMALSSCFLAPAAVAYMLHSIRPYLSRPSGGVVSNSNLTLFVLAAELRPVLHFFRLVEERTLHLQRIVSSLPASDERQLESRVEDLAKRLDELSSRPSSTQPPAKEKSDLASGAGSGGEVEKSLRTTLQPQLDALNRAVRRYEKRATTTSIVTEARLQDLEARLKDALSLAAAASRQSQRSSGLGGFVNQILELVKWVLTKPVEALKMAALMPVKVAGEVWRWLFGPRRVRKKGTGSGEGKKWANEFRGKSGRVEAR